MTRSEFRTALCNRLLVKHAAIEEGVRCTCGHATILDGYGIHLQKCKCNHYLGVATHDAFKLATAGFCRAMGLKCTVKPRDAFRSADAEDGGKIDMIITKSDGQQVAIDFVVTSQRYHKDS